MGKREESHKVLLQEDCPHVKIIDKKTIAFEFNEYYSELDGLRNFLEICEMNNSNKNDGFKKKKAESMIHPKFKQVAGKVVVFVRLISQNARDLLI